MDSGDFESEAFVRLDRLPPVPPRYDPPIYGSARRATADGLAPFIVDRGDGRLPSFPEASLLLEEPGSRCLTALWRKRLYLSADLRQRGILVVGQPGAGKTVRAMPGPLTRSPSRSSRSRRARRARRSGRPSPPFRRSAPSGIRPSDR